MCVLLFKGNKVKDLGSVNPSGKSLSLPTPPRYQNRLAAKLPTTKVTSSVAAAGNGQQVSSRVTCYGNFSPSNYPSCYDSIHVH